MENKASVPIWWEAVLNRLDELVLVTDVEGRIQYVNRAFQVSFGYSMRDLQGKFPNAFIEQPPNPEAMKEAVKSIRRGDEMEFKLTVHSKQGHPIEASVYLSAFSAHGAEITHYVAIARDLSQERLLQKQLHEVQRMEAMGQLARGIAHRFNNVLGAISGQTELLQARGVPDAFTSERAKRIQSSVESGRELVSQIQAFVRRQSVHTSPIDFASVLRQTLRFFENLAPEGISIKSQVTEEACFVMGVSEELHQIALNLLNNSLEAVSRNEGVIEVSLNVVNTVLSPYGLEVVGREQPCARLRIKDNGQGIHAADESQLFEPFFTTRSERSAVGMGLTVVRATVERYRGKVAFFSSPNEMTVFEVYLPLHISESEADKDFFGPRGKGERILLLDDESFITESGSNLLREVGYEVHTLNDAELLATTLQSQVFDLLIIDMSLPQTSGLQRLKTLDDQGVSLPKIILTTPLETMPEPWESATLPVVRVLPKPCPARELTESVRAALEPIE